MSAIEAIGDGVLAAKGSGAGLHVLLACECLPRNRMFRCKYAIIRTRKSKLHGTANLAAVEICHTHDRSECADIKKIRAHPLTSSIYIFLFCLRTSSGHLIFQMLMSSLLFTF